MWSQHWKLNDALATPDGMYGVSNSYVTLCRYGYVAALEVFPEKKEDLLTRKSGGAGQRADHGVCTRGAMEQRRERLTAERSSDWLISSSKGADCWCRAGASHFDLLDWLQGLGPCGNLAC